jgi:shikimate kinase
LIFGDVCRAWVAKKITFAAGQSLREMYDQRFPLYEKYADITIDCSDGDFENCIGNLIDKLHTFQG